jgi:ribosome-binding protein aMBF1 (putative translation factor)
MDENKEMMAKIALFVKEKREVLGMSQADLAYRVFADRNQKGYISLVENEKKEGLTIKVLAKILKELNSDIAFIEF